jgi:hypothetical protein
MPSVIKPSIRRRIQKLSMTILNCQLEIGAIKDDIKSRVADGQHNGVTAYTVCETYVKRHLRRGYRAVRIDYSHE